MNQDYVTALPISHLKLFPETYFRLFSSSKNVENRRAKTKDLPTRSTSPTC